MKTIACLLAVVCLMVSGCRSLRPDYSLFKSEQERQTDDLWRQGFGYNNPNADRGQKPVNFDGSPNTFKSAAEDIGGRAVANVIAFTVFEGIPAIFQGLSKKFRR